MPDSPGLKLALSQASRATPAKPTTRPTIRQPVSRSFSQAQAIKAPNMGTVAFRMADSPVLMDSSANAKQANGMPELSRPMKKMRFQFAASTGSSPRSQTSGSKKSAAIPTRTAAVGSGPNSTTPMRVNRNDEPQIAASSAKSSAQLLGPEAAVPGPAGMAVEPIAEVREVKADPPPARLQGGAGRSCAPARLRNRSTRRCCPSPGGRAR